MEVLDAVTYPAVLTELAGDRWAGPGLGSQGGRRGRWSPSAEDLAGPAPRTGDRRRLGGPDEVRGPRPRRPPGRRRGPGQDRHGSRAGRSSSASSPAGKGDGRPATRRAARSSSRPRTRPTPLRQALEQAAAAAGVSLQRLTAEDSPLALPFAAPPGRGRHPGPAGPLPQTRPPRSSTLADLQALRDVLGRFLQRGRRQVNTKLDRTAIRHPGPRPFRRAGRRPVEGLGHPPRDRPRARRLGPRGPGRGLRPEDAARPASRSSATRCTTSGSPSARAGLTSCSSPTRTSSAGSSTRSRPRAASGSSRAAGSCPRRSRRGPSTSTRPRASSPASSRPVRATTSGGRRPTRRRRRSAPRTSTSILGVATEAEARALGVAEGDPVTAKKTITDFAPGPHGHAGRRRPGRLRRPARRGPPPEAGAGQGQDRHLRLGRPGGDRALRGGRAGQDPQAGLRFRHRHLRLDGLPARIQALRLPARRPGRGPPGHRLEQHHAQDGDPPGPGHRPEARHPRPGRQLARRQRRLGLPRRRRRRHPPLVAGLLRPLAHREDRPPRPRGPDGPHPGHRF
ncbi:MAG: hypothetical protein M0C28_20535 [Candidatus Moduliflexus flocculans]|nr:hypothetical protein [Candidatus Moduliflexus flocculans]